MRIGMLGLGFLAATLGALIVMESAPNSLTAPGRAAARPSLPLATLASGLGDAKQVQAWVATILARPLFEPSRRPPSIAATVGSGPSFPRLAGIVITPHRREAIFAVPGKKEPVVVTAGSRLAGVLITAIENDEVSVSDEHGTRKIRPSFDTTTGQGPAPTALPVTVDLPPVASRAHAPPFASIRGLTGRPLGLATNPDQRVPPSAGVATNPPSLPAPAPPGGSP